MLLSIFIPLCNQEEWSWLLHRDVLRGSGWCTDNLCSALLKGKKQRLRLADGHEDLSHLTMITWHIIERKGLLVDIVNQGTWAKTSVLSTMSHVHHIWTSQVPEIITSWHPSKTAQPISATLALEKIPSAPSLQNGSNDISFSCQDVHMQRDAEVLKWCKGCTKQEIPTQALGSLEATRQHNSSSLIIKNNKNSAVELAVVSQASAPHWSPHKTMKTETWFHGGKFKNVRNNAKSSFHCEVYGCLLKATQKFFRSCWEYKPCFLVLVLDAQHF